MRKGANRFSRRTSEDCSLCVRSPSRLFARGLVDRYLVAAGVAGFEAAVVLNKVDLGVPAEVEAELALRQHYGVTVIRTGRTGSIEPLRSFLADHAGAWALVGHSGVGKTSLVAALCPGVDVGPVAAVSDYWGTGKHNRRLVKC